MRKLMKVKRDIRKELHENSAKEEEKSMLKQRDMLITEYLNNMNRQAYIKRVNETIKEIQKGGGINGQNFWEFKKKMDIRKKEERIAMKNKDGIVQESVQSIKNVFVNFYQELLQTQCANTAKEKQCEEEINKIFNQIATIAQTEDALEISKEEVVAGIKQLKKKKAADMDGIKNEILIYGGADMENSITALLNRILKEKEIPSSWQQMKIKSIYKNKGSRAEMKNTRGLFITNVVSKLYEKVLSIRNYKYIESYLSSYQCGGVRNRGTSDHLFTVRAMIDYYKFINKDLYIFFGDLEKCFDKLWLRDSIVELWKTGMPAIETYSVYLRNKIACAVIETPVGVTQCIEFNEIVRQGTVYPFFAVYQQTR
eukprot:gene4142-4695_t